MSFEAPTIEAKKSLYPERASSGLDETIEDLKKIEEGGAEKEELSEEEKKEVLAHENKLGEYLEKIYEIKVPSSTVYLDYFLTEAGQNDFQKTMGFPIEGTSVEDLRVFFGKNRKALEGLESKIRSPFLGRASSYAEKKLQEILKSRILADGSIDIENIPAPQRTYLVLNPANALEKISGFRNFKKNLRIQEEELESQNNSKINSAKRGILEIYRRRVNEIIASFYGIAISVAKLKEALGEDALSEEEKKLLENFAGLGKADANYSRFDKFIHGAENTYNEEGMREQISEEIKQYADEIEKIEIDTELHKKEAVERKGLNYEMLMEESVDASHFGAIAEEILEHYGQKSTSPSQEYSPDRVGPAPDNKWQFVSRPEYKSMSVTSLQKVIKSGIANKSMHESIAILGGHEIEGHFVQALNRTCVPLRLSAKIGTDRTYIFSEGGAMFAQDQVTQQAFGFRTVPHPHYIRAMIAKLEGGNYLDCIKTFFESAAKLTRAKKEAGIINTEEEIRESEANLKLAINRARRLFKDNVDLSERTSVLTKSKDTVYLEQLILMEKLKKHGLEKYAFVGGASLKTLVLLNKLGLANLNTIKKPDYYSLQIWDRMKDNYKK